MLPGAAHGLRAPGSGPAPATDERFPRFPGELWRGLSVALVCPGPEKLPERLVVREPWRSPRFSSPVSQSSFQTTESQH